jgi:hypothetical protein
MRDVLQQLSQIPGVVGSLACGPQGELLASAFPPLFDELTLHRLSGLLAEDSAGISKVAGPGGSFDLRFARGRALVRPFRAGTLLVVGTAQSDAQLLGLSVEQALRRLEEAQPGPEAGPADGPPLDEVRDGLRQALIHEIGPFGEIAFEEAWKAWAASGRPVRSRLADLLPRLAGEIDEPEGRERFSRAARALLD